MTAPLNTRDMLFRVDMDMALLSRTAAELLDKMGHRVHALRMFSGQAAVLRTDLAELTLTVQHCDAPRTRLSVQPASRDSGAAECAQLTEMLTRQLCDGLAGQEIGQRPEGTELSPAASAALPPSLPQAPRTAPRRPRLGAPRRGAPLAPRDVWQAVAISSLAMMMAIASLGYYAGPHGF